MVLRSRSEARTYHLIRRIAAGGMGEVYEAEAVDIGRRVAIKRMLEQTAQDQNLTRLFLREIMVASTLEHHNVVEVIDVGQHGSDMLLVMELVDGPTLAEILELLRLNGHLPPLNVACGVAMQIARGLTHAHERELPDGTPLKIVHRDIAPENILISQDGAPKLVDFGLATLAGQNLTQPGIIRGRPRSLAPEQARGEFTDARTDIFALGAVLFEMTSGEKLYPDESITSLLWKVAEGNYAPIAPRMPRADPALIRIIKKALDIDPTSRYRSARQFERELGAFQATRELRVTNRAISTLIQSTWPEVQHHREASLNDSVGELDGKTIVLEADKLEPIQPASDFRQTQAKAPKRWKRPHPQPRPAGWDRIIPRPKAPARNLHLRHQRSWFWYSVVFGAVVLSLATWAYLHIFAKMIS